MFSDAVVFFREFILNPRQLGSAIPSSGFLKSRIVNNGDLAGAGLIVELGPGNGGTTRAILKSMRADASLLTIELNQGLFELTRKIDDPRFIAHHGNAADLSEILAQHQLPSPDVVISGIPFSTMDANTGKEILRVVHQQLTPGGRFVAYQLSRRVERLNSFFEGGRHVRQFEWLNVPPLWVSCWTKAG